VRVLPLAKVGGTEAIGQPSNIVRVLYGAVAPGQSKSPFIGLQVTAFNVELASFEYRPYQLIERWPPGCKDIPTDQRRTGFDAALHALEEVWNFASEAYQWVKSRAVDLAGTLTAGIIPRQYLEVALDGALVAVGIPPDVPNFGEMMRSGVDGIAKEMAKGVVDQLPASQLAPTLGNLAADVAVAQAEKMTTDELKRRIEQEIQKRSRDALLTAATEIDAQIASQASDMYCRVKVVPPIYRGMIRNTGNRTAEDVKVVISDSATLFNATTLTVDIAAGKTANWSFAPKPLIRIVQRSQLREKDVTANEEHWWNQLYQKVPTRFSIAATSQRQCPGGTFNPALCQESIRTLHQSTGLQPLTQTYNFSMPQPRGAKAGDTQDDSKKDAINRKKGR
jgi:hypothetical protein